MLVRQLRQQAGLSQKQLADLLEKPQSFVSKYESGERRLDILELRVICHHLGTDLHSFVARLEEALVNHHAG
jgi:transcriptional regulator with XRE-family HTH domain